MKDSRYLILALMYLACGLCPRVQAQSQSIQVEREGNDLRLVAPQLHFLEGKPLEQLHDGSSVNYVFDLTITPSQGGAPFFHLRSLFILSFDLWEEKFSAVQSKPPGRSRSHMTAAEAENWCLDNMPIPLPILPVEKTFVIKLDCWTAENDDENGARLTLSGLVDVFSRKGHDTLPHWQAASGPVRLAEIKEKKNQ